jgi:hypothetical protein
MCASVIQPVGNNAVFIWVLARQEAGLDRASDCREYWFEASGFTDLRDLFNVWDKAGINMSAF